MNFLGDVGTYMESYRDAMRLIKKSQSITPKQYGMMVQKKKRKKKRK